MQTNWRWAPEGAKHVESPLKADKRMYTAAIWANGAGEILLIDYITEGKTAQSLPAAAVRARFPLFFCQNTESHWATTASKQASTRRLWDLVVAKENGEAGATR